jgi:RNA recognition motif-containing protein
MADYYETMGDVSASNGLAKANDEDRKLFLGGLSWDTEEQDILNYFSKFGQIANVNIKYDSMTGKPRGFGFITFNNTSSIDQVLAGGPHMIKNRAVDPKRPRTKPAFKKIFVGGVDADMSKDDIKAYFERFGTVEGIECPFDKQRGRRREFCFIIFDTEEAAEAAVSEPKQLVGNKECDIKKAQPPRFQGGATGGTPGGSRNGQQSFSSGGSYGGGGGGGGRNGWSAGYNDRSNGSWNKSSFGNDGSYGAYPYKTYTNSNYYPPNY